MDFKGSVFPEFPASTGRCRFPYIDKKLFRRRVPGFRDNISCEIRRADFQIDALHIPPRLFYAPSRSKCARQTRSLCFDEDFAPETALDFRDLTERVSVRRPT